MVILKRAEISCKFSMTNTTLDKKGFFFTIIFTYTENMIVKSFNLYQMI